MTTTTTKPRRAKKAAVTHLAVVPDPAPVVEAEVVETTDANLINREQACKLIINGLSAIREGIIAYYQLGLTCEDLHADLTKEGWTGSKSALRYHLSKLRKSGLIPPAEQGARNDLKKAPTSEATLKAEETEEEERLYPVTYVTKLREQERDLKEENQSLKAENEKFNRAIKALEAKLKSAEEA